MSATPFEICKWKQANAQFNYHITVDKKYHSVPYQYIKYKVDMRIAGQTIEFFITTIESRLTGRLGQYSTVTEHMLKNHQKYLEWNGDRFHRWADSLVINTRRVVDTLPTSDRMEQ